MPSFTCGIEKNDANVYIPNRLTDFENEITVGRSGGGGIVREFGMNMYTLLYLKWITNKDPHYNTWNSAQCCGRLDGKGVWGRKDTCICMAESLYCLPETITILLIGYNPKQDEKF